jgi:phytoene dehydrogenase-like protein
LQAGVDVTVPEAADVIGGGLSSGERTVPGVLAAVDLAHPIDDGRAGVLTRSVDDTTRRMGVDGRAWRRLFEPLADHFSELAPDVFGPLLGVPRHPLTMASFGAKALIPATTFARRWRTDEVRALWAGNAAHAWTPLNRPPTTGMASILVAAGGSIETGVRVASRADLPTADIVMFDLPPAPSPTFSASHSRIGFGAPTRRFATAPGRTRWIWRWPRVCHGSTISVERRAPSTSVAPTTRW